MWFVGQITHIWNLKEIISVSTVFWVFTQRWVSLLTLRRQRNDPVVFSTSRNSSGFFFFSRHAALTNYHNTNKQRDEKWISVSCRYEYSAVTQLVLHVTVSTRHITSVLLLWRSTLSNPALPRYWSCSILATDSATAASSCIIYPCH